MVEIKRLSYFVQVAEDSSLSKAAESLCIAQPALSRQIHMLEEYLGFPLFVRTSRGMRLTKEGEFLHDAVATPLRNIELAVENMRSLLGRRGPDKKFIIDIGLGINPAFSQIGAESFIKRFQDSFQSIKLRILEGNSESLITWLESGILDFAILDSPSDHDTIENRLITMNEVVLVSGSDQPSPGKRIEFHQISGIPLILPGCYSGIRKVLDDAARTLSVDLQIEEENDLLSMQLEKILAGKGCGVMPLVLANTLGSSYELNITHVSDIELKLGFYLATRNYGVVPGSLIAKVDSGIQEMVLDLIS